MEEKVRSRRPRIIVEVDPEVHKAFREILDDRFQSASGLVGSWVVNFIETGSPSGPQPK